MIEIGVDIGGTFTDVVCREANETLRVMKVPTSRTDPSIAVLEAVRRLREEWGVDPADIQRFVHGTTVATNAVLERKGPKTGILMTRSEEHTTELQSLMRNSY